MVPAQERSGQGDHANRFIGWKMEPVKVPNETGEGIRCIRCSPDCSNQGYKKVLRKTSVPVTGFMEVLGGTRTGLPSGYVICYI